MFKQLASTIKAANVFTSGLFLGVLVGVLMTTKSGDETRKDLVDKTLKFKELTKEKLEELEDVGVNKVRKVGHALRDAADRMCLSIDELDGKAKNIKPEDIETLPVF